MEGESRRPLSASSISLYQSCPRKYAFRYIERVPPEFDSSAFAFGKAVHSALEWFHLERLESRTPDPAEAVRVFRADWDAEQENALRFGAKESRDSLRQKGENLVSLYVHQFRDLVIEASEQSFEVPLVDPETGEVHEDRLTGRFDLLLPGDTIMEMKTSARRYDEDTLRRHVQLSTYAYAFRLERRRDPKLRVVVLLKTVKPAIQVLDAHRTLADDTTFVRMAVEVSHAIRAGAFPPAPSWQCKGCEYQGHCPAGTGTHLADVPRAPAPLAQASSPTT